MPVPAHNSRLSVRRGRYDTLHRRRRGRKFPELSFDSDVAWSVRAGLSVIALIDPKALTRESIIQLLGSALAERVKLLGVSSFEELLELAEAEPRPSSEEDLSLVILYIRSAGVTNTWVQRQLQLIKAQRPELPVIMLSDRDDVDDVKEALNWGVRGYISTSIGAEVAVAALTLISAGGTYIPANVLGQEGFEIRNDARDNEVGDMPGELNLTSRERAVIDLLREGNANKVIAMRLNMRESTVKVHVRNILKKLHVNNRTHAATIANRLLPNASSIARLSGPPQRPH